MNFEKWPFQRKEAVSLHILNFFWLIVVCSPKEKEIVDLHECKFACG